MKFYSNFFLPVIHYYALSGAHLEAKGDIAGVVGDLIKATSVKNSTDFCCFMLQ